MASSKQFRQFFYFRGLLSMVLTSVGVTSTQLSPLLILLSTGSTNLVWTCRRPFTCSSIKSLYGNILPFDGEEAFLSETAVKSSLLARPASASNARGEFFATGKENAYITDCVACAIAFCCSGNSLSLWNLTIQLLQYDPKFHNQIQYYSAPVKYSSHLLRTI